MSLYDHLFFFKKKLIIFCSGKSSGDYLCNGILNYKVVLGNFLLSFQLGCISLSLVQNLRVLSGEVKNILCFNVHFFINDLFISFLFCSTHHLKSWTRSMLPRGHVVQKKMGWLQLHNKRNIQKKLH